MAVENVYTVTGATELTIGTMRAKGATGDMATVGGQADEANLKNNQREMATDETDQDLMAPGHLYNSRTGTGIQWLPANSDTGSAGKVRLWTRGWNGPPTVLAEAEHHTGSEWEYWYGLEFAGSFPQVTHWWFGDAWTGTVRVWEPEGAGTDPESSAPMLSGWMRFGPTALDNVNTGPALPWTVVLTDPLRVSTPLPPMSANLANLPLQLLLAETIIELLGTLVDRRKHNNQTNGISDISGISSISSISGVPREAPLDREVALTSLVRREDLPTAFPTEFGPWRLDRLPDLTPREALCRVQGLGPV